MKKEPKSKRDPDMLNEHDFRKGVRAKYAQRYGEVGHEEGKKWESYRAPRSKTGVRERGAR
jgi:hypothetical protein